MNELSQHSYLSELNDIQRQAVTTLDGPIMVIAGPGSGKTRVLTYRIAHLLNSGIPPYQILSLTFTNKAAREMKERIESVVGSGGNKIWAGTFHSLFARILRVEAHRIGYPNDFTIYDTDDSKSLVNEIIKTLGLDKKTYNNGAVRSRISHAKSNLVTPQMYASNDEMINYDRMNKRPMTYKIYEAYYNKCKRAGAMDFDDLLLQMFRLLYQNPEDVRTKYQRQFQYLLVDEFQDTNYLQYEILKLLVLYEGSNRNICIVGDDAQSIYSFRGATIENILQFSVDFPTVKTFKLEQNYRSTNYIVKAANEVITNNRKQIKKEIWTDNEGGTKIKLIKALSDSEEGKRIADTIIEHKNRHHLANSEIAILYRTNAQSRIFEENLRRFNIPYRIYGGLSFYHRKEIKDLLAYFRISVNSKDDEALKRSINYPRRGIGNGTIEKIRILSDDNDLCMWDCISKIKFSARAAKSVGEYVGIVKASKEKTIVENAYDAAMFITKKSGIIALLKAENTMESQGRIDNINALLDGIQEFVEDDLLEEEEEANTDRSLAKFLQSISLMTDQDETDKEKVDCVTMMSVHAAKGLEYKAVYVVGLEENLFPSFMSLSSPDSIDEERRLFYVAITRAEQFLTLSYSNSRYQYGQIRFNDPSRFLEEISDENYDADISFKMKSSKSVLGNPKKLQGNFKSLGASPKKLAMDPKEFRPNHMTEIKEGMTIIHLKFGKGKVMKIDDRDVATIHFENVLDTPDKRIMLQYAKLQIVEEA